SRERRFGGAAIDPRPPVLHWLALTPDVRERGSRGRSQQRVAVEPGLVSKLSLRVIVRSPMAPVRQCCAQLGVFSVLVHRLKHWKEPRASSDAPPAIQPLLTSVAPEIDLPRVAAPPLHHVVVEHTAGKEKMSPGVEIRLAWDGCNERRRGSARSPV